jgi:hypothetical protein
MNHVVKDYDELQRIVEYDLTILLKPVFVKNGKIGSGVTVISITCKRTSVQFKA